MVKNPPTMRGSQVQSLGWEDPLEKDTVTHSSIFTWRSPQTEEPDRPQSRGSSNIFQRISQMMRIHRLLLAPITRNFKMIVEMKRRKKNFDNINNNNPFKEKYSLECIFCAKHYSG